MTTPIPISTILVENRQRIDIHNKDGIKESLAEVGTIQPIVLTLTKDGRYRLLAGGRRLHFLTELGHTYLHHASTLVKDKPGFVLGTELPDSDLYLYELEENLRRSDMSWQEKCLGIAKYHETCDTKSALEGKASWTQAATGNLLGIDRTHVSYNLTIAGLLRKELGPDNKPILGARYWPCENMYSAWQLLLRDKVEQGRAILVAQAASQTHGIDLSSVDEEVPLSQNLDSSFSGDLSDARSRYESNPLNTIPFDEYLRLKQEQDIRSRLTVNLSSILKQGDSIAFMNDPSNAGRFNHIITDIPYGIDMSNLNQQNPHGGMSNIDQVEELHDVSYNLKLIADFFPAAFKCTKDNAFVITWGDQMLWQFMHDHAIKAGFAVQRWPITWVKTSSCMNQCVNYNTTKDTEIAIVCRKKGATLVKQPQTSVISASRDDLSQALDHPFAKPFAVWEFLVNMVSFETQSIFEPFSGRGSGVISMLRLKRNVIGMELDVAHYNALVENVKQHYYLPLNPNFQFK